MLNRWLLLFLLLASIAITLAYQSPQSYLVDLGGPDDCPTLGKTDRCPILDEWNAQESDPSSKTTYRWSKGGSPFYLSGIGNSSYQVTIRLSGARPNAAPPVVTASINGRDYVWQSEAAFTDHTINIPRQTGLGGDLSLTLYPPTFTPAGDARELGVRVDSVRVAQGGGLVVPDLLVLASLLLVLLLCWLLVGVACADWRAGAACMGLLLAAMLYLLASQRLAISSFAAPLAVTMLWAGLLWLLVLLLLPTSWAVGPARGWLATAVATAFALRYAGMVYPQFITIDLTYHAHRIEVISRFLAGKGENFYFQSNLPNGTPVPYPSAYYLLLAPFSWLLGGSTEANRLLLRFTTSALDVGVLLLLYRFARRFGTAAGLFAATLYAVGPAVFQMLSQGNHSNLFAQAAFVAALVCAAEGLTGGSKSWLVAYAGFSLLTLLGHYGTAIASIAVTGVIALVWLLFAPSETRGRIWPLAGAFTASLVTAYLLYYVHYNTQIGGQVANLLSGGKQYQQAEYSVRFDLRGLLGDVLQWQGWVILPLAGLGCALLTRRGAGAAASQPARLLLVGWLLAGGLLTIFGLLDRYTVRYNIILLPALCICGGLALQWLAQRSRLAAGLVVGLAATYTLLLWGDLVLRQYH